jgi:hypothetical protein
MSIEMLAVCQAPMGVGDRTALILVFGGESRVTEAACDPGEASY